METITKKEADKLGLVPKTNYFKPFEKDLMHRMFEEIRQRNPEARIVVGNYGMKIIYVKAGKPEPRRDNPRIVRGKYPAPRDVVGSALRG